MTVKSKSFKSWVNPMTDNLKIMMRLGNTVEQALVSVTITIESFGSTREK